MRIAVKTLDAINTALIADQGAKFRGLLRQAMPLAEDAYSEDEGGFRTHLGASLIGRKCNRELWYSFRWATEKKFDGRMLRLFNRGHLEEPRFVALLQMIGCTVYQHTAEGKQFRIPGYRGHYGGSLDAVVTGCPDIENGTAILAEFKTHGDKSFQKLKTDGVMSAKWEHFIQMQQYMGEMNLPAALYMAVNKNDDEIHAEIVMFDRAQYDRYKTRAVSVIECYTVPPKLNESPAWYECKFCDHHAVCHKGQALHRTCRTCIKAMPVDNGEWICQCDGEVLSKEDQLAACETYMPIK